MRQKRLRALNRHLTNLVRRYHLRCDEIGGFADAKPCPRDMRLMLRLSGRLQKRIEFLRTGRNTTDLEQLAQDEASEHAGLALMGGEPLA
jgi:hypothetical protein